MVFWDLLTAAALAAAAVLALIYAVAFARPGSSWAKTLIKTGSVAALALAGVGFYAPGWVIGGLALGALGDYCLSRPNRAAFLAGVAAFGLGHLVYAAGFFRPEGLQAGLFLGAPIIALALSTEFWLMPDTGSLRWPVRGYVAVITAMAVAALTLDASGVVAKIGAVLFVMSDFLLAYELFVVAESRTLVRRLLQVTLWAAYWGAQVLILLGSLSLHAT